jgi:TupA-like ATPgrasp
MQQLRRILGKAYRLLPAGTFARLQYFKYHREILHLNHPRTYSEMLMWLKVHGRLDRYHNMADKYAVREYVTEKLGPEYVIPLLGVWDSADEIDFDKLPDKFVLKANHGCDYNVICTDKSKLDIEDTRRKLNRWIREDFYKEERELQYKGIKPKIIAEKYLEDESGQLRDYKFYCVEGVVKMIQYDVDRFTDHKSELMDPEWNRLKTVQVGTFSALGPQSPKPKALPKLLAAARALSKDFWFVRVDLYLVGDQVYFGELTFTPGDGLVTFVPAETGDLEFTKILDVNYSTYNAY